ncbi:hypothetical protein GW17_00015941 [Ensete ventricosum]|nr:hypothetical protein GW17_00015941 [Ensete ventricosum]RZR85807.1 hypothetical protein BHM03_00012870 [Ensete ventricosum]
MRLSLSFLSTTFQYMVAQTPGSALGTASHPRTFPPMEYSHGKGVALFFILFISFAPSLRARKLLGEAEERVIRPMEAGLVLNILPRGSTPPSSPSKGGNGVGGTARINTERMLGSVPSPGIGH